MAKFNPNNTKNFGLNNWNVDIQINNHSGKEDDVWSVPGNIWHHLVLEQDLTDWPAKGLLTFHNPRDGLERFNHSKTQADYDQGGASEPDPPYYFRMDGRDEIIIRIRDAAATTDESVVELPKDLWELHFDCVIYDVNDNESINLQGKNKTLYFWDKRYQLMQEKNIQFSTGRHAKIKNDLSKPVSQLTDTERSLKTGLVLKALLTDAGFGDSIDEDNWDEGLNLMFYTSPANSTVAEDVKNILDSHISKDGDKCIFYFNRRIGEFGKWQLIPINEFFNNAGKEVPGELQLEHFFIEDYGYSSSTEPFKAPYDPKSKSLEKNLRLEEFNKITNYEFVDMAGMDNAKAIVSKPVHWYSILSKTFGLDYNINEIANVKERFKELYTNKLYAAGEPFPLMTLNKYKTEQHSVEPQFTYSDSKTPEEPNRSLYGRANILYAGVFLNECIHFTVPGAPFRIPGTFIGIDRKGDVINNYLDNKLCGQWFVVNVKHIMYLDKYITEIMAVKTHAYEKIKIKEDI